MKFKARTTAPSNNSKYWRHTSAGGVNSCIHIKNGSCLPNCVGYAWGRFYEIMGSKPKLSRNNAEDWYGYNDGYKRGKHPRLGAVICWRKGKVGVHADGAGHVAVVEKIKEDGSIVISESGYNSFRFRTRTIRPPYSIGSAYTFQGFIYNPEVPKTTYYGKFPTLPDRGYFKDGDKGTQVKYLQKLLNWCGADLSEDGDLGPKTTAAVKEFQKDRGLAQDGLFGKDSLEEARKIKN